MSVPGVGLFSALAYVSTVEDPSSGTSKPTHTGGDGCPASDASPSRATPIESDGQTCHKFRSRKSAQQKSVSPIPN